MVDVWGLSEVGRIKYPGVRITKDLMYLEIQWGSISEVVDVIVVEMAFVYKVFFEKNWMTNGNL